MARLSVRAQPGASRDELSFEGSVLRARLAAPAVDGKANKRLIEVLAKRLGVPRSDVRIVHGESGRNKLLEVDGLETEELRRRLGAGQSELPFPDSICHRCDAPPKYVRTERSVFILCPRMPEKYPRQPVAVCSGFRPREPAADSPERR